MDFSKNYENLERAFKKQVEMDNVILSTCAHYLPNVKPRRKVDFVLVAMEPTRGKKQPQVLEDCRHEDCKSMNFVNSIEDFILHFCIRKYLCKDDECVTYHITDLAKGQMLPSKAREGRWDRWERWYALLYREIQLIAKPQAPVISIGKEVERFLNAKRLPNHVGSIVHYSRRASKAHGKIPRKQPQTYRRFKKDVTACSLKAIVCKVLKDERRDTCVKGLLNRLQLCRNFSESRKKLAFTYKVKFESLIDKGCMCPYDRYTPTWRQP